MAQQEGGQPREQGRPPFSSRFGQTSHKKLQLGRWQGLSITRRLPISVHIGLKNGKQRLSMRFNMAVRVMSFMAHIPQTGEVLRDVRQPRIIRAQMLHRDGEQQDIVIRNISDSGIGASAREPAPVRGERIAIILPGGQEVKGIVRWFSARTFGMQVDTPIDFEGLSLALERQGDVAKASAQWHVGSRHRVHTPQVDLSRMRRV